MKDIPDKSIDLILTDPPYGLGDRLTDGGHKKNPMEKYRKSYEKKRWDELPEKEYFQEMFRCSKNQIIWGGNYFIDYLKSSRCFLIWDKKQMMPTFSRCEFAWTSFDKPSKIYEKSSSDSLRFHPTQKPVELFRWIIQNYSKPDDLIMDCFSGSGACACACYLEKRNFIAIEKDEDYYKSSFERLDTLRSQGVLF